MESTLRSGLGMARFRGSSRGHQRHPVCCLTYQEPPARSAPSDLSVLGVVALLRCLSALSSSSHWKEPREMSRGAARVREGRGLS